MSELIVCADCGMPCTAGEYHPFAACLMFKACHDSTIVRANLPQTIDTRGKPVAWAHDTPYGRGYGFDQELLDHLAKQVPTDASQEVERLRMPSGEAVTAEQVLIVRETNLRGWRKVAKLQIENASLRAALEKIVSDMPASDSGMFFIVHMSPDGEPVGEEQVDPAALAAHFYGIACEALNAAREKE